MAMKRFLNFFPNLNLSGMMTSSRVSFDSIRSRIRASRFMTSMKYVASGSYLDQMLVNSMILYFWIGS